MATPPQLTHIAFAAGIDESQQVETLDPTTGFPVLENVRQESPGAVEKRWGFGAQTLDRLGTTARTTARRLFNHGTVPCVADPTSLDTYSRTRVINVPRGRLPEATYSTRPVAGMMGADTSASIVDLAHANGYLAVAFIVGGGVWISVEGLDGAVLRNAESLFASGTCALASYGVYFIALFNAGSSSANISALYLDTTSAATIAAGWQSMTNPATDKITAGGGLPPSTMSTQSLTDRVAFAYINNSGGASRVTVKTMSVSGVLETATVNTSSTTPSEVAVAGSTADTLWIAWNEGSSVKVQGRNASSLATTLATTGTIIGMAASGTDGLGIAHGATGKARLVVTASALDRTYLASLQTSAGTAAVDGSTAVVPGVLPSSRPIYHDGRYYVLTDAYETNASFSQALACLCDVSESATWIRPVCNIEPGLSQRPSAKRMHLEAVGALMFFGTNVVRTAASVAGTLVTVDWHHNPRRAVASHGGTTHLGNGVLSVFDGERTFESPFVQRPSKPAVALTGTGITGTYKYVATYEYVDADGRLSISGVSLPSDSITAANQTVQVTVRPLAITSRLRSSTGAEVKIRVYRADNAVAPYVLVGELDNGNGSSVTLTFNDNTGSTVPAGGRLLLGTGNLPGGGGLLDRLSPGGADHLVSYNGMLVAAHGSTLTHSGQYVVGEATWFNPVFQLPLDDDVTAMVVQDGTIFSFTRSGVYALAGEPPSDNGQQGGLGLPRRLAVDVGAAQSPTCVTSLGVFFVSDRGIELLTRGQTVEYIGEKVKQTFAAFPIVRAMTFDPESSCVLIELAQSVVDGLPLGDGRTLVFDTRSKQWQSIDRRKNQGGAPDAVAVDGGLVWNGSAWRYAWLGTEGRVYVEDHATNLDPGSAWVTMRARAAWLKNGGLQGKQFFNRVQTLSRKSTDHNLSVALAYNYSLTFETPTIYTRATINDLLTQGWPITQLAHDAHDVAEGMSVAVEITDATPTGGTVGTGAGATWIGLTFDAPPKPGVFEVPEAAR